MQRVRMLGASATVVAVVGYGLGVFVPYPGRAFSLTLGMVGVALFAVGGDGS